MTSKKQDPNVQAVKDFQGGRSLEDPEIGPAGQIEVSPWSEQQLAERIANGEGEQVREELAEVAKNLKGSKSGGDA